MANLSSCYFCSSALDATVQTYELPDSSDERTTVALCSSCKEKLDVVLETAGVGGPTPVDEREPTRSVSVATGQSGDRNDSEESVVASSGGASTPADDRDSSENSETVDADGESGEVAGESSAESTGGSDPADVETATFESEDDATPEADTDDAEDPVGDDLDEGLDDPFEDEELLPEEDPLAEESEDDALASESADDALASVSADDALASESADDALASESDTNEAAGDEGGLDTDVASEFGDNVADEPSRSEPSASPREGERDLETDERSADTNEKPSGDTGDEKHSSSEEPSPETGGATDSGGTGGGSKTSISALEYNRVMRMLQNREFPVDREEITTVATSAYDLTHSECAQVIDLAVDRGLLDERDGQLHRPQE